MKKYFFELYKNFFLNLLLIIPFGYINSLQNITLLHIGIKNKFIEFTENKTIFRINTNFLYLNISVNNFNNVEKVKIVEQIFPESNSNYKYLNSNITITYSK